MNIFEIARFAIEAGVASLLQMDPQDDGTYRLRMRDEVEAAFWEGVARERSDRMAGKSPAGWWE